MGQTRTPVTHKPRQATHKPAAFEFVPLTASHAQAEQGKPTDL